jgi:putative ABC transport system substrate-binding protein
MRTLTHAWVMIRKITLGMVFFCASAQAVFAADAVVVVLATNSGPYKEALQGFQEAFGSPVPIYSLTEGIPKVGAETQVIVAIGGKAALYGPYPPQAVLIYCLAPGTKVGTEHHRGRLVKIHTSSSVNLTIGKIKELQPALKKLAILWTGESIKDYFTHKDEISKAFDVEMVSKRVMKAEDLPDQLRALKGKVDAIWLPPDAAMVTPQNFATIKEFAAANALPFYVPTEGLVEHGAVASFSASFKEIGGLTAKMTQQALQGSLTADNVFPEQLHYSINLPAARNANLKISPEVLKQAEKVIR